MAQYRCIRDCTLADRFELVEGKMKKTRSGHVCRPGEIIETDNLIAPRQQRLSGMVTDETGGAGDQNPHVSYSQRLGPNARVLMTPAIPPAGAK